MKNPNSYLFYTNHRVLPNRRNADTMSKANDVGSPDTARGFQTYSNSSNNRRKNIRENRNRRKTNDLILSAATYRADSESG